MSDSQLRHILANNSNTLIVLLNRMRLGSISKTLMTYPEKQTFYFPVCSGTHTWCCYTEIDPTRVDFLYSLISPRLYANLHFGSSTVSASPIAATGTPSVGNWYTGCPTLTLGVVRQGFARAVLVILHIATRRHDVSLPAIV